MAKRPKTTRDLFTERTPEAAAQQLAVVLAWLLECHMATEEGMSLRKSTPKYEAERMATITRQALHHCHDLAVPPRGLLGKPCQRLEEALKDYGAKK